MAQGLIGRCGRKRLKDASPFATLLLEISSQLIDSDISALKLALHVDGLITTKRRLSELKNGADVLSYLHQIDQICKTDTRYLEQLLIKSGRKDLVKKVYRYHEKQTKEENSNDQTQLKIPVAVQDHTSTTSTYTTDLKVPVEAHTSATTTGPQDTSKCGYTALKELKFLSGPSNINHVRSVGDGSSLVDKPITGTCAGITNDTFECSPMVIDENSQELKLSQMSISDDDKERIFQKTALLEDDLLLSSQY